MAKIQYKNGVTSVIFRVKILDSSVSTGAGKTGLGIASAGLIISTIADNEATATVYTAAGSTIETIATLGTFAAPTATKCRFKEVDATNHPGLYEIQIADARWAVSNAKSLIVSITATSVVGQDAEFQLSTFDPYDGVRGGFTSLPNAAAAAAGGMFTRGTGAGQINQDANGRIDINLVSILGTLLTETAGQIAGGFKKLFDVNTPVFTLLSINQTGDNYPRVGAPVGASISADIAATKALLPTALVGGRMDSSVGAVAAGVDFSTTMKTSLNAATPVASLGTLDTPSLHNGTAQAGAASTITLASGASSVDNFYKGDQIKLYGGTGAAQVRQIISYVGSTRVATIDRAWVTNPDNTSTYSVLAVESPQIDSSLRVAEVVLADTVTTYTGNTPQTGDSFARLGAPAGASVSADVAATKALLPTALVSGRMDSSVGAIPSAVDFSSTMKTSLNNATPAVTVSDKTGFSLSAAGVQAIWDALVSAFTTVGSIGKRIADYLTGDAYVRLGAPAGASVSADIAAVKSDSAAIKLKTDTIPVSPAAVGSAMTLTAAYDSAKTAVQVGSAMTLTAGERDAIAAALLDLANGIETGVTLRQAQRLELASLAGKLSGAAGTTVTIRNAGDTADRIVATVDSDGNRTAVVLTP